MGDAEITKSEKTAEKKTPLINFRFFLFAALGLIAGIVLYCAIRLHRFSTFDFVPLVLLVFFSLRPFSLKRVLCVAITVVCFCSAGVGLTHWACERYLSGVPAGEYTVRGTAESVTDGMTYDYCVLKDLSFNGVKADGKMRVTLSAEELRTGDVIEFTAAVARNDLPYNNRNAANFPKNIRYTASPARFERVGQKGILLKLNAEMYDLLQETMTRDEASIAYALLTGNSTAMDAELSETVRRGGIAHIFAVSGLHIGIVYAAVMLACKPLKRYAALPALVAAFFYCALCAFTVSSVRAFLMCAVLSAHRFLGRKSDLLSSLSFAALLLLLISPAWYLSAGFLLSFGAVLGLALFSHTFAYGLRVLKFPAFLADYLAASLSVQIFTLPVLLEIFGYASAWAILFNFLLLPCLPVLLLSLVLCTLVALITTWTGIMAVPAGMVSLLLYVLSVVDFSFVIAGFSLGAGAAVAVTGGVLLTQRVGFARLWKGIAAGIFACLFTIVVVTENVVVSGCRITVSAYGYGSCALVRTKNEAVLVIDGDISLQNCRDFLNRTYGKKLNAVICLSEDELGAVNVAAFLNGETVYAMHEIPTGLQHANLVFSEEVHIGELTFRYVRRGKALLFAQGLVTEFDFDDAPALDRDFFVGGDYGDYTLKNGRVRQR